MIKKKEFPAKATNTIRCRPECDCVPVKAVWCRFQCSGGGCPDETRLLAVLSQTKQHLQQPITGSCTKPGKSKPQGLSMPVKLLVHAYLHNVTDAHECFTLREIIAFFVAQKFVYSCLRYFCQWYFQAFLLLPPLVIPAEANLLHHLVLL